MLPSPKDNIPKDCKFSFDFLGLEGNIEAPSRAFMVKFKKDNDNNRTLQK
jgi:hypothetical protein